MCDLGDIASIADPLFGAGYQSTKALGINPLATEEQKKKKNVDLYGIGELLPELQDIAINLGKRGRPLRDLVSETSLVTDLNQRLQPRLLDIERGGVQGEANILSDVYRSTVGPLAREEASAARGADIQDVYNLGPQLYAARRAADPLFAAYADSVMGDLSAGSELTPSMRREIQEYVRAGQSARGLGLGPSDVYAEAMSQGAAGQALHQQRLQNVAQALGIYGDPMLAITGRPSQSLPFAQNAVGQSQAGAASVGQSPYNPYAGDVFSSNLNAYYSNLFSRRNKAAADKAATYGLIGDIAGGVLGAAGGAAGLCWAAREIFGAENPQWKQFRTWLLTLAPRPFMVWYLNHGRSLAKDLRADPTHVARIRHWMERCIDDLHAANSALIDVTLTPLPS